MFPLSPAQNPASNIDSETGTSTGIDGEVGGLGGVEGRPDYVFKRTLAYFGQGSSAGYLGRRHGVVHLWNASKRSLTWVSLTHPPKKVPR